MKKEILKNLKIGDIVSISSRASRNLGKRGIVTEIGSIWDGGGSTGIYVKPLDCEFEFGKGTYLNEKEIATKTYMYRHTSLKIENNENKKNEKIESIEKNVTTLTVYAEFKLRIDEDKISEDESNIISVMLSDGDMKIGNIDVTIMNDDCKIIYGLGEREDVDKFIFNKLIRKDSVHDKKIDKVEKNKLIQDTYIKLRDLYPLVAAFEGYHSLWRLGLKFGIVSEDLYNDAKEYYKNIWYSRC